MNDPSDVLLSQSSFDDDLEDVVPSDFEPEEEDDEPTPITAFTPVNFSPSIRRISDLFSSKNDGELDTNPGFQRGYVWDKAKASRLIESVLLHVPLPIVYTAEEENGTEVVIDGQQRLITFFSFMSGIWPLDGKPFRLQKLKLLPDLKGLTYQELPADLKRAFRGYGVNIVKIGAGSNPNVKFEIFERLNTGAVTLSEQELRNCLHRGALNELIRRLTKYENFKKCIGISKNVKRMLDAELVLRFCALYERTHINYNTKMKAFLNDYMAAERHASKEKIERLEDAFKLACDNTYTVFGENAFRRYVLGTSGSQSGKWEQTMNKAIIDIQLGWFARYEKRQIIAHRDQIRDKFIELVTSDEPFKDAITLATTDVSRLRSRFDIWKIALNEVITTRSNEKRLFNFEEKKRLFALSQSCSICGQGIASLDDADVDHVVPYSQGGATIPENARLTHRFCNRSRARSN